MNTGACVSAVHKQFLTKFYGQFPPKMSAGSYSSVQTVSGHMSRRKYPCEFHVMQSLAYDAILGRDFLLNHGAQIGLVDGTLSFRKATPPVKQLASAIKAPLIGTFLPQPQNLKKKKTEVKQADLAPSLKSIDSK